MAQAAVDELSPSRRRPSGRAIGSATGSTTSRYLLTSIVLAVALLASACGGDVDTGSGNGSADGTTPGTINRGGAASTSAPATPPPVTLPSLAGVPVRLVQVAAANVPTAIASRSSTPDLYVAQKDGRIRLLTVEKHLDPAGRVMRIEHRLDPVPLLDISGSISDVGERGLLGLVFSSDGRKLYIHYTARDGAITVDEFRMNDDTIDVRSRRTLLRVDHPETNHNGGQVAIGPDGYLYIGIGDGGGSGDPNQNGQNPKNLYGKILRIDPEGAAFGFAYGTPSGNPFKDGVQGAPEVWAFGLRNPWRFSWDRETKDLWIADVGEKRFEEINFMPQQPGGAGRGANFGWNKMEGRAPFNGAAAPPGHVPPLFDFGHENGECSVVGGYVYRGKAMPGLRGVYFFADYCIGELRGLRIGPDNRVDNHGFGLRLPKGIIGGSVTSFGEDNDGEVFVLSAAGGIYKIQPN